MVLVSKEKGTRKISMIADRDGLFTLLIKVATLKPAELNEMKLDAATRQINGVKQWTWRLDYIEEPKKK